MINRLLSIIVPVYNSQLFLDDCLNSIFKEIDSSVEVVIVDDGSFDDSEKVYMKYVAENQDNVILYKQENKGVSTARNLGIEKSSGNYLMFVDSDDFLKPGWFKKVKKIIQSSKEEDVIYILSSQNIKTKKDIIESIIGIGEYSLAGSPSSKLIKRNFLLEKQILFNPNIIHGEDSLFNLTIAFSDYRFIILADDIYEYRFNDNSECHTFNSKLIRSNLNYLNAVETLFNSSSKYNEEKELWFNFQAVNSIYMIVWRLAYCPLKNSFREFKKLRAMPEYKRIFSIKFPLSFYPPKERAILMFVKAKLYYTLILLTRGYYILKKRLLKNNLTI